MLHLIVMNKFQDIRRKLIRERAQTGVQVNGKQTLFNFVESLMYSHLCCVVHRFERMS